MNPSPRVQTGIAAGLLVVAGVVALEKSGPRKKDAKSSETAAEVVRNGTSSAVVDRVSLSRKSETGANSTASGEAAEARQAMDSASSARAVAEESDRTFSNAPRMKKPTQASGGLTDEWSANDQTNDGWAVVSASAPGNSLSFSNRHLTVQASKPVPASGGTTLSVLINEPEPDQPDGGRVEDQVTAEPVVDESALVVASAIPYRGFTREEELFRTKWGWVAFDQAKHALQTDSD